MDAARRRFEDAGMACEFCDGPGGEILWHSPTLRIVAADDSAFPGLCRVVIARHVVEVTDLAECDRQDLMRAVFALEAALRATCAPDKMNLASLGNVTAHVHWHVIPRWHDDSRYPDPIWCSPRRSPTPRQFGAEQRAAVSRSLAADLGPSK